MTVVIVPPGDGSASLVRFEEEREVGNPKALRGALARDASLRGATITNAKVAGDAYYVLIGALATVVGHADPRAEFRRVGRRLPTRRQTHRGLRAASASAKPNAGRSAPSNVTSSAPSSPP
jgi:hypothetical protein